MKRKRNFLFDSALSLSIPLLPSLPKNVLLLQLLFFSLPTAHSRSTPPLLPLLASGGPPTRGRGSVNFVAASETGEEIYLALSGRCPRKLATRATGKKKERRRRKKKVKYKYVLRSTTTASFYCRRCCLAGCRRERKETMTHMSQCLQK